MVSVSSRMSVLFNNQKKKKVNGKLQIGKILFYFVYFNVKFSDFCVVKSATLAWKPWAIRQTHC